MTNNAAERAIRPLALGRKNYLFAGSDTGGERAAVMYTFIETAKLNTSIPRPIWPTSSSASPTIRASRIDELLPWRWQPPDAKPPNGLSVHL